MRAIFLDIDGVICIRSSRYNYFDKTCCDRVKTIIDKSDAKIVVSSAWRKRYDLQTLKALMARGYEAHMKEYVKVKDENVGKFDPDCVIGATPHNHRQATIDDPYFGRGVEISEWLAGHPEISDYVVLDDDIFDIAPHREHLVHTDSGTGISDSDIPKALKILGL